MPSFSPDYAHYARWLTATTEAGMLRPMSDESMLQALESIADQVGCVAEIIDEFPVLAEAGVPMRATTRPEYALENPELRGASGAVADDAPGMLGADRQERCTVADEDRLRPALNPVADFLLQPLRVCQIVCESGRGLLMTQRRSVTRWFGVFGVTLALVGLIDPGMASAQTLAETRQKAGQGAAAAQFNLGGMYATGRGAPQDDAQAFAWYRKAADQGLAAAQFNLGGMYATGRGVPQDDAQAFAWYRKAADQGLAAATFNLGFMYATGQGVPQDDAQAVVWVRKAADQGDAAAQVSLGYRYDTGRGVPQDDAQAFAWYRKAADQGRTTAQFNLGGMYATGRGVPLDYVESLKWSNLAVIRATGDTQNQYAASRDALAMLMTPAQIFEAQQRAAEWQADFEKRQAE